MYIYSFFFCLFMFAFTFAFARLLACGLVDFVSKLPKRCRDACARVLNRRRPSTQCRVVRTPNETHIHHPASAATNKKPNNEYYIVRVRHTLFFLFLSPSLYFHLCVNWFACIFRGMETCVFACRHIRSCTPYTLQGRLTQVLHHGRSVGMKLKVVHSPIVLAVRLVR